MVNITIQLKSLDLNRELEKSKAAKAARDALTLDDRCWYALLCIEAEEPNKDQAVKFLRHMRHKLNNSELRARIDGVLSQC